MALRRLIIPIAALTLGATSVLGCGLGRDDDTRFAEKKNEQVRGPEKPKHCKPSETSDVEPVYPSTISRECLWRADGTIVGQVGDVVVVESAIDDGSTGTHQLFGYDAATGAIVWQGETIQFGQTSGDTNKPYERAASHDSRILYNGDDSYVAIFSMTVQPSSAVSDAVSKLTIRTYKIDAHGKVVGKRYNAPEGFDIDRDDETSISPARLLLKKRRDSYGDVNDFLVLDPARGKAEEFAPSGEIDRPPADTRINSEIGYWAGPEGMVVSSYDIIGTQPVNGRGIAFRDANGGVAWTTHQKAPANADPNEADLSGLYGNYAVIWWRIGSYNGDTDAWQNRKALVAVHDIRTGEVITSAEMEYKGLDTTAEQLVASPNGHLLASGDVIFDLKNKTHLNTLPAPLKVQTMTDSGVGYGTGNDNHVMAVRLADGTLLWDKEAGALPIAAGDETLIFGFLDEASIVAFPIKK